MSKKEKHCFVIPYKLLKKYEILANERVYNKASFSQKEFMKVKNDLLMMLEKELDYIHFLEYVTNVPLLEKEIGILRLIEKIKTDCSIEEKDYRISFRNPYSKLKLFGIWTVQQFLIIVITVTILFFIYGKLK